MGLFGLHLPKKQVDPDLDLVESKEGESETEIEAEVKVGWWAKFLDGFRSASDIVAMERQNEERSKRQRSMKKESLKSLKSSKSSKTSKTSDSSTRGLDIELPIEVNSVAGAGAGAGAGGGSGNKFLIGPTNRLATFLCCIPLNAASMFISCCFLAAAIYTFASRAASGGGVDWDEVGNLIVGVFELVIALGGLAAGILKSAIGVHFLYVGYNVFLVSFCVNFFTSWLEWTMAWTGNSTTDGKKWVPSHDEKVYIAVYNISFFAIVIVSVLFVFGIFNSLKMVLAVGGTGYERKNFLQILEDRDKELIEEEGDPLSLEEGGRQGSLPQSLPTSAPSSGPVMVVSTTTTTAGGGTTTTGGPGSGPSGMPPRGAKAVDDSVYKQSHSSGKRSNSKRKLPRDGRTAAAIVEAQRVSQSKQGAQTGASGTNPTGSSVMSGQQVKTTIISTPSLPGKRNVQSQSQTPTQQTQTQSQQTQTPTQQTLLLLNSNKSNLDAADTRKPKKLPTVRIIAEVDEADLSSEEDQLRDDDVVMLTKEDADGGYRNKVASASILRKSYLA